MEEGRRSIKELTIQELESMAYNMICELKNIESQLRVVEQEIMQKKKETENDKTD